MMFHPLQNLQGMIFQITIPHLQMKWYRFPITKAWVVKK